MRGCCIKVRFFEKYFKGQRAKGKGQRAKGKGQRVNGEWF